MWHHLTLLAPSWFSWPVGWSAVDKLTWGSPRVPSRRDAGFSMQWLLLLPSTGCRRSGFSSHGAWAWLPWGRCDLSSWTSDWAHVPYIGRWILNHWITREVPKRAFNGSPKLLCFGFLVFFFSSFSHKMLNPRLLTPGESHQKAEKQNLGKQYWLY